MEIATHKQAFSLLLKPYFEMLLHQKDILKSEEWIQIVKRTRASVLDSPEQYLGNDLPSQTIMKMAVLEIFDDFLMKYSRLFKV